ncbi:ribonuclease HII [Patulibacter minatonensis]|uniref:ribonuclease HII n=1 Tax=Patulibacter minatonensis TaxID=298163 RepID=UPI0004AD6054|nr:ribonuclease HII [Patulibacter minatonensis]
MAPTSRTSGPAPVTPRAPARRRLPSSGSRGRRLFGHDRALGTRWVVGADEAGRGCLAGPLVAGAVLFDLERIGPREVRALGALDDSKAHTAEERERLFGVVLGIAVRVASVSRCVEGLDARGLHVTNLEALSTAARRVARPGALCLTDGFAVPDTGFDQRHVVGGDAKSAAIAAASIVAKVTRDRFMHRAAVRHPAWGFEQHMGYGTTAHQDAIREHGLSVLHRRSFRAAAYEGHL